MAYRYGAVALALALVFTVLIATQTALTVLASWLIGVNLVTFFLYAYDKSIAGSNSTDMRVPERSLLFMTLVGGTPGAWISMTVFRHKVSKHSFQQAFWLIVLLQVIVIIAILVLAR